MGETCESTVENLYVGGLSKREKSARQIINYVSWPKLGLTGLLQRESMKEHATGFGRSIIRRRVQI